MNRGKRTKRQETYKDTETHTLVHTEILKRYKIRNYDI